MKVAFVVECFSVRGTEVAIYDYAKYNETLLGNKSIIVYPNNHKYKSSYKESQVNFESVEKKFFDAFDCFMYSSLDNLDAILKEQNCDVLYHLKSGEKDFIYDFSVRYVVHCVFTCTEQHKHGDVYAAISPSVAKIEAPIVPHICLKLPECSENLRKNLNIPDNALVFGRYGGFECFNVVEAHNAIKRVVETTDNIYFLFMYTEKFFDHPKIIHLDRNSDNVYKSRFVNSCDAMIHGLTIGESFGLAIAEFASSGKPIILYDSTTQHRNHHHVLEDTGIYYHTEEDLYKIITEFDPKTAKKPVNYSEKFNPEYVMKLFKETFLYEDDNRIKVKLLCNWTTTSELHEKWQKMIGKNDNIRFVDENPDYWVILNKPPNNSDYIPSRTIVMGMEPDTFISPRWHWYENKNDFLYFLDENYHNNLEWWLNKTKDELLVDTPRKTMNETISAIVSSQYFYPGHKLRIDFLKEAEKELKFDIFGWDNKFGFNSYRNPLLNGKEEGLFSYKYTFACENTSRTNYCTEKLIDGILSECLVFYWGCPNVSDFLDSQCYIPLDLTDIPSSIEKIKNAIENNEWEKRIDVIRKMKRRILNRLSFIPRISGLIQAIEYDKYTVNLDSRPDKWETHTKGVRNAQVHNVKRFSAIRGDSYDLYGDYIQSLFSYSPNFVGPNKNTGAIVGCALSHYTLWQETEKNNRPMLIMEDDVTFQSQFIDRFGYLLNDLNETEWELVFIGYHKNEVNYEAHGLSLDFLTDTFTPQDLIEFKEYLVKYSSYADGTGLHGGGTFGYIVNPRGAQKLLNMVKNHRFYFPVDYQILVCGLDFGLNIKVCPHQLVTSPKFGIDTDESDVQKV